MQETVRDLVANDPATYPTLPAGYRQVFEAAARIGFTGFEFLSNSGAPSFPQHASAEGGASVSPTQIRAWLDESGLEAVGHYNASATPTGYVGLTPATIDAALATAHTLGQPQTGSLDATMTYRQKGQIDPIIETWNQMAVKASKAGIPIYTHAHSAPWNFLLDIGPRDAAGNYTRSSGVRVMEYFLQHTDPRWVKLEMDVFWAYVGRFRFKTYTAADGTTVTKVFDPAETAGRFAARCPIFHAKDGISVPSDPNGWVIVPCGFGDIDFDRFFRLARAGRHRPYWSSEQDNAPGAAARYGRVCPPVRAGRNSRSQCRTGRSPSRSDGTLMILCMEVGQRAANLPAVSAGSKTFVTVVRRRVRLEPEPPDVIQTSISSLTHRG